MLMQDFIFHFKLIFQYWYKTNNKVFQTITYRNDIFPSNNVITLNDGLLFISFLLIIILWYKYKSCLEENGRRGWNVKEKVYIHIYIGLNSSRTEPSCTILATFVVHIFGLSLSFGYKIWIHMHTIAGDRYWILKRDTWDVWMKLDTHTTIHEMVYISSMLLRGTVEFWFDLFSVYNREFVSEFSWSFVGLFFPYSSSYLHETEILCMCAGIRINDFCGSASPIAFCNYEMMWTFVYKIYWSIQL